MAWSKVFAFADPFQYTAAIRAADMQIFPTAKGRISSRTDASHDERIMDAAL